MKDPDPYLQSSMTPQEITRLRDTAKDIEVLGERFTFESDPWYVVREAVTQLYAMARYFEQLDNRRMQHHEFMGGDATCNDDVA